MWASLHLVWVTSWPSQDWAPQRPLILTWCRSFIQLQCFMCTFDPVSWADDLCSFKQQTCEVPFHCWTNFHAICLSELRINGLNQPLLWSSSLLCIICLKFSSVSHLHKAVCKTKARRNPAYASVINSSYHEMCRNANVAILSERPTDICTNTEILCNA